MLVNRRSATTFGFIILIIAACSLSLTAVTPNAKALILWNSGNPTPDEQFVLEYINRARANPVAEGQRLGIDIHEGLEDDPQNGCYGPEYVGVRPPLAMNPLLLGTAQAHSEDMYNQNYFSHTDPNGTTAFQRIADAGYEYVSAGENMAAGSGMSATDLEDFMMVDSGTPCRPHRMNLLDIFPYPPPVYLEVGVGYYQGSTPNGYGDSFITEDFGTSANYGPFLTGVVYTNADGSNFYKVGEGISGVTITPSSGNYYAISSASGGYAFPIPPSGTITVTAQGAGFGPVTQTITLTGTNVELDFTPQGTTGASVTTNLGTTTGTISTSTTQSTTQTTTQAATQSMTQTTSTPTQSLQSATQTASSTTTAPLLELVAFQSSPSSFTGATSPGTITACGNTYSYFEPSVACGMSFGATANLPSPMSGWMFDHWTWTGGVACSNGGLNPASCSAYNSGGVLIAVYAAQVNVLTNPSSSATVNWGSCSAPGVGNGASFFSTNFGSSTAAACNIPTGYTFSSWSCSGGLSCQTSTNPTTVTITGPGTIALNLQPEQVTSTSNTSISTAATTPTQSATTTTPYSPVSIVTSTVTTSTQTALSTSTPMVLTPIPGFPWESILIGILLGSLALALLRRRK